MAGTTVGKKGNKEKAPSSNQLQRLFVSFFFFFASHHTSNLFHYLVL